MSKLTSGQIKTIVEIATKLEGRQYAIRGTASLVLQGVEMEVEDIDIVCGQETALYCNEIFKDSLIEAVEYKESEQYKSYFGRFQIGSELVEVMGEWQIKNNRGIWTKSLDATERVQVKIGNQAVWVTTIESELKMFAAMERWNAFWKIKRQISS